MFLLGLVLNFALKCVKYTNKIRGFLCMLPFIYLVICFVLVSSFDMALLGIFFFYFDKNFFLLE